MLNELRIKYFVFDWFKKLDLHVAVSEIIPMLSEEGLEIQLPEATYHSIDEFKEWYDKVTNLFFNESHELKMLNIEMLNDKEFVVNIIVNWQTQVWNPPEATSIWKGFDCYQKWLVVEDKTKKVVIKKYIVEKLIPMLGSPEL